MTEIRHLLRLASVALAAIVGMLPAVGEASACSVRSANRANRSCCVAGATAACCCASPSPEDVVSPAVATTGGGLFVPNSRCECRAGGPAESAPKSTSPSSGRRTDQERSGPADRIIGPRPAIGFTPPIAPTASPPTTPLYLRTSRLLI